MGWIIGAFAFVVLCLIAQWAKMEGLKGELEMYKVGIVIPKHNQDMRELGLKITGLECLLKEATTFQGIWSMRDAIQERASSITLKDKRYGLPD
jgi:hypothetical protein